MIQLDWRPCSSSVLQLELMLGNLRLTQGTRKQASSRVRVCEATTVVGYQVLCAVLLNPYRRRDLAMSTGRSTC